MTVIKLALYALGGQGGGVFTGWVEAVARANGYVAQATSVAGVSQRTGATVYYVEMAPVGPQAPVFSLMPAAGDVDVMVTAEMMEAGRSILRGYVTPDRTTLITSTHRALAVSEKMVPGDGIASSEEVLAAAEVLPFSRAAFEAVISGKGAEASMRAFAAGFEAALGKVAAPVVVKVAQGPKGPAALLGQWERLALRARALPVAEMALAGLRKVVEFQDLAYGAVYLERVEAVLALDAAPFDLSREAAKYIANAMAYDDVIRVADLKTRAGRVERIATEMGAKSSNVMQLTEFLHPRAEEIVGLLPVGLGRKVQASPVWMARIDRMFNKGRRLRTDGLRAFGMLYVLGGIKRRRLGSLRHAEEVAHLEHWLAVAKGYLPQNYALAVEVIRCRRLVKGYSDTHARGLSKFDRVLAGIALVAGREDAADWARRLREAALLDEEGTALDGALATVRSFV